MLPYIVANISGRIHIRLQLLGHLFPPNLTTVPLIFTSFPPKLTNVPQILTNDPHYLTSITRQLTSFPPKFTLTWPMNLCIILWKWVGKTLNWMKHTWIYVQLQWKSMKLLPIQMGQSLKQIKTTVKLDGKRYSTHLTELLERFFT